MFVEEDDEDVLKFSTRHINEIFIAENEKGKIDTIFRRFKISARAAIRQFGDVSTAISKVNQRSGYDEVNIIHAVYPRNEYNPDKQDKKNMPFESVYMKKVH